MADFGRKKKSAYVCSANSSNLKTHSPSKRSADRVQHRTFGYLIGFAMAKSMARRISPADDFLYKTDGVANLINVLPSLTLLHPQPPRSFTTWQSRNPCSIIDPHRSPFSQLMRQIIHQNQRANLRTNIPPVSFVSSTCNLILICSIGSRCRRSCAQPRRGAHPRKSQLDTRHSVAFWHLHHADLALDILWRRLGQERYTNE